MRELVKIANIKAIVPIQTVVAQEPIVLNFIHHQKEKNVLTDLHLNDIIKSSKREREVMNMNINDTAALVVFFGILVVGMILACVIVIGTKIANKYPNSKFSKWWYEY